MSRGKVQHLQKTQKALAQPTLFDSVTLDLKDTVRMPVQIETMMENGTKEVVVVKKATQQVQLQTKLALMIRAPQLFRENDQHWRHIKNGVVHV